MHFFFSNTVENKVEKNCQQSFREHCRRRKIVKGQRIRDFAVRLSTINVRSYTHKVSPTWLPKHELNREDSNKHANVDREASALHKKTTGDGGMPRAGERAVPREAQHTSWLHKTKWAALKTCTQVTLYTPKESLKCNWLNKQVSKERVAEINAELNQASPDGSFVWARTVCSLNQYSHPISAFPHC